MFRCLIMIACAATLCAAQGQCQSPSDTASDGDAESPTTFAATIVSSVSDSTGDAQFNAPAFQDLVRAEVTKTAGGDFELLIELAGAVPDAPLLPPPARTVIWWVWSFDLDPMSSPRGYPLPSGSGGPADFLVIISWDGSAFAGTAIDRRPLVAGGEATVTPVTFTIDGTIVEAVLPSTLIGDVPASFGWGPRTVAWSGPVGSAGYNPVDFADTVFNP